MATVTGYVWSLDERAVRVRQDGFAQPERYPISKWADDIQPARVGDLVELRVDSKGWVRSLVILESSKSPQPSQPSQSSDLPQPTQSPKLAQPAQQGSNGSDRRPPPTQEWMRQAAIEMAIDLLARQGSLGSSPYQALPLVLDIAAVLYQAVSEGFDGLDLPGGAG